MKAMVQLSASKIKKAESCSWAYWATYNLKVPDASNDGAKRGWICHLIFELLGDPRHKEIYDEIILKDSIFKCEPIRRLVSYHSKKMGVNDEDNLKLIDNMTLAGLHYDFFGEKRGKPDDEISEQEFNITVDEGEKLYSLRGFIDKLFFYKEKELVVIRDFKTSKSVFKGKELEDNLQDLIYTLAVKKMFPEFTKRQVEFLFLKFDLNSTGNVKMKNLSAEELEGLELQLTQIQNFLDNFDEDDAISNLAATKYEDNRGFPPDGSFGGLLQCGKDGYKIRKGEPLLDKEGNPIVAYICPYRKPLDYYVIKNEDGKIVKSFFKEDKDSYESKLKEGEFIELVNYKGCPHWNSERKEIDDFL